MGLVVTPTYQEPVRELGVTATLVGASFVGIAVHTRKDKKAGSSIYLFLSIKRRSSPTVVLNTV